MRKWSRTIGLLFTAGMSVYSLQAFRVNAATAANSPVSGKSADNSDIKLLDDPSDSSDPFATANPDDPTTKPSDGQSVTANDVSVSDSGTVEIHVNDANLVEVLRMLSLQSQKNIIASNQVSGHVTANLYGVTVREALDAILHANGYAYREKGNFIYVYTAKEIADIEKAERQPTTEVFRLFYTPAANAVTMIKPVMSPDGQVSSTTAPETGLPTGVGDSGGDTHSTEDMLVVTDYPDNLEKIRKVIAEIDRRPQQILIEATILQASLNEDNALGIDFQVLGGVDFSTITTAMGQIATAGPTDANINPAKSTVTSIGTGNSFSSQVPPGGLKLGVVSNNLAVFLSALESITDTTVLANPKVLALNKQARRSDRRPAGWLHHHHRHRKRADANCSVPRNRYAAGLPAVHWRRRLHPHGNPPGRFQRRLAGLGQLAVQSHHRSHEQCDGERQPHDRDRRTVPRIEQHHARADSGPG